MSLAFACWACGSYARVSQDDGDKNESNSIRNQKELIRSFMESHAELNLAEEYADDGYSGVNFERPAFRRMIEDISSGKINCIIIKDLSRFGRNYIETGKYLEQIFPEIGVRVIAINDNYDSARGKQPGDQILLPFKNLINDSYSRDISVKVRSNLNAKRMRGDFVGAFAPYGYRKSEENRNRLEVDLPAAEVVKRIFRLKMEGKSNQGIADLLNREGVLTPYEYKRGTEQGKNFHSWLRTAECTKWYVNTVLNILQNEIYIGNLIQGKRGTPNYKIKKVVQREPSKWIRVENVHEPIVPKEDFEIVQRILGTDTRAATGSDQIYLFSGLPVCGRCGMRLDRKASCVNGEKYVYYGCFTEKKKIRCKGVSIRESALEHAVLTALQRHIAVLADIKTALEHMSEMPFLQHDISEIDRKVQELDIKAAHQKKRKAALYSDYQDGLIDRDEYLDLKNIYDEKEERYHRNTKALLDQKRRLSEGSDRKQACMELLRRYQNISKLDRKMLVMLVTEIKVFSAKKIEICFAYQDEFKMMCRMAKRERGETPWQE